MAFTDVLNTATPAAAEAPSGGDDKIREFKRAIIEILGQDHNNDLSGTQASDDTLVGFHEKCTLIDRANPTAKSGAGIAFSKQVSSHSELHWIDDDGTVTQITSNGKILTYGVAGDWQLSSVATARTGWTNVSATYSDKFMRINATPLTTGGVDTHTHTGPSHTHTGTTNNNGQTTTAETGSTKTVPDNPHTHTFTTAAGGTEATGSANNIPAFVQVVVFQKD